MTSMYDQAAIAHTFLIGAEQTVRMLKGASSFFTMDYRVGVCSHAAIALLLSLLSNNGHGQQKG